MNSLRFCRNRSVRFCRPRPVCFAGPSGVFSVEGPRPTRRSTERSVVPIRGGFVRMDVAESGFRSSKAVCRPTADSIRRESVGPRRAFRCRRSIVSRRNRFCLPGGTRPRYARFSVPERPVVFVSLCGAAFHRSAERGICGLGYVFLSVPAGRSAGSFIPAPFCPACAPYPERPLCPMVPFAFPHRNHSRFPFAPGRADFCRFMESRPAAPDSCLF